MLETVMGAAAGVVGAWVTRLAYRAISSEWPASYAGARSILEHHARGSILRYVLFRVLPLLASTLAFVSTSVSLGFNHIATAVALAITYALLTDVRALFDLKNRRRRRAQLALLYGLGLIVTIAITSTSVMTIDLLHPWIPSPRELVFASWTAAFAAIASLGLQRALHQDLHPSPMTEDEFERALGSTLLQAVRNSAREEDCDPIFLRSILAAEMEQRPAWFRKAEPLVSRLSAKGTYGVAQISSKAPLSDEESIQALARLHHGFHPLYSERGYLRSGPLAAEFEKHNADSAFVERALEYLHSFNPPVHDASKATASDGRPSLMVHTKKRTGAYATLIGSYMGEDPVQVRTDLNHQEVIPASGARADWEIGFPIEITHVGFNLELGETVSVDVSWL